MSLAPSQPSADDVRLTGLVLRPDAVLPRLFGLERDDVDYIMDTFPIVRRRDEKTYGEYRTKRVILEISDELADAISTGRSYQTRLDPPPASGN